MNQWTEHYSVLKAEVEDPEDPGTGLNRRLLEDFASAERVLVSGQALSHCVANTIRDMIEAMDDQTLQKLVLLEDTTSNVPGFEDFGERILQEARRAGITVCTTNDI
jgi:nicotinamidase-related amidase